MKKSAEQVDWIKEYADKERWLTSTYPEVAPMDFYRDLFSREPIQKNGAEYSGLGSPILQFVDKYKPVTEDNKGRLRGQTIIFDGLNELYEVISETTEEAKALGLVGGSTVPGRYAYLAPVSYFGRRRLRKYAHTLYALTLDIDYVPLLNLRTLMAIFEQHKDFTMPTYVVNSGKGIHLYYVLEEPIALYPNRIDLLSKLKQDMATVIWKTWQTSVVLDHVDKQSCLQAYRVVGTETKFGMPTTAYITGKAVSKEDLNLALEICYPTKNKGFKWEDLKHKGKTGLTLEEAREKYPDWYAETVEGLTYEEAKRKYPDVYKEKEKKKKFSKKRFKWLYENYKKRFLGKSKVGNRYHGLCILFADAAQVGIPKKEVLDYAKGLLGFYNNLPNAGDNPFTEKDIESASQFYDTNFKNWMTLDVINAWSGVGYERAKRNNNPQAIHCEIMRSTYEIKRKAGLSKDTRFGGVNGNKRGKGGRKSAEEKVRSYLKDHPNATKAEVIRGTGLTKPTVYKWYNAIKQGVSDSESAM